jgi:polyisoprenyl-phosphate glycosyltransferase
MSDQRFESVASGVAPPPVGGSPSPDAPLVSIVAPAFNEESNIERLERELLAATDGLPYRFEFILIDNNSTDGTGQLIKELCLRDQRWKYIRFSRTFPVEMSITAGYEYASGDALIVLYSDLQEPPELIPEFISKWEEGWDVVYGAHTFRHGEFAGRALAVRIAYRVIGRLAEVRIPPHVCDFKLITREVRDALLQFGERLRYTRGLIAWIGFRQIGVPYERRAREAGESKTNLGLLFKYLLNGIFGFSLKPLRIFMILGSLLLSAAAIWGLVTGVEAISGDDPSSTTLLALLILAVAGINSIGLWVVGEYVGRSYFETLRRPLYIVSETVNLDERPQGVAPAYEAVRAERQSL